MPHEIGGNHDDMENKNEVLHDIKHIAAAMAMCIDDTRIKDIKKHLEVLKSEIDRLYNRLYGEVENGTKEPDDG